MKDPQRLLDTNVSVSELEQRLLRAGASEQPPMAAAQRLAEQLGVGASLSSKLPPVAASKLGPLPVLAIVAAGITLAGVAWLAQPPAAVERPQTPEAPVAAPAPPAPPPQEPAAPNTLALEIARIDAARQLLAASRAKAAITALQEYQRDFPGGVLRQEAEVLTIEAHGRAGDTRRARSLAARFLAQHPDSPHSARLHDLLEALGPDAR